MKCANCGAELKVGCIYCSVCGHEAQIVPDYNVLEDDYLKTLLEEENSQTVQPEITRTPAKKTKKKKLLVPILLIVVIVGIGAVFGVVTAVNNQRNNSFDYQYTQGILAKKDNDYENAVIYFKRALELDENSTAAMMELAQIYRQECDMDAEETMLLELLLLDTEDEEAYEMLIELYDTQKRYNDIIELRDKLKDTPLEKLFYAYVVEEPEFSKTEGTYSEEGELEITAQEGYTIYYAFGDTDPITEGNVYQGAIPLMEGETIIRAVAKDERDIYSEVVTAAYDVRFVAPKPPTVTPASGSYSTSQMITVHVPEKCTVYYTWDGSIPSTGSARYETPLEMPQGNNVLALVAIDHHGLSSRVVKFNYIYLP